VPDPAWLRYGRAAEGAPASPALPEEILVLGTDPVMVTAGEELAYCHYLCRCGGTDESGTEKVGWMRVTVCCRRIGDRWTIVHEHFSSPFDVQSGKALLDAQP